MDTIILSSPRTFSKYYKATIPFWPTALVDSEGRPLAFLTETVSNNAYSYRLPIEISELEYFSVTINFPPTPPVELIKTTFRIYMPGADLFQPKKTPASYTPHSCHCQMVTLMRAGCQCGGI